MSAFIFDKNYDNHEQVRPYFADYCKVRAELDAAGQYPYNASFEGRIPGIIGPSEQTGIYMLQTMYKRDADTSKRDDFVASGGFLAAELSAARPVRGDLAVFAEYSGGTGWRVHKGVRVEKARGRVQFYPPRARSPRVELGGTLYFRPEVNR